MNFLSDYLIKLRDNLPLDSFFILFYETLSLSQLNFFFENIGKLMPDNFLVMIQLICSRKM
jgi:hypothetical protein